MGQLLAEQPMPATAEPRDDRRASLRTCVATRASLPPDDLIRFVVGPDGALTPDLKRRLPGRGVHVFATRAALELAMRKRAFARSLRSEVIVPADMPARIEALLERAALDMLSLANKAGLVVPGTAKVLKAIDGGRVRVLLHANEASEASLREFAAAVRRMAGDAGPRIVRIFGSDQLDLALGRSNVIHAALVAGPACDGFLGRVAALERWRHGALPEAADQAAAGRASGDGNSTDPGVVPTTDDAMMIDEGKPVRPAGSETE